MSSVAHPRTHTKLWTQSHWCMLAPAGTKPSPHLFPGPPDILKSALIIFVMGGPGCGKGTQCQKMATKFGFCHVGLGQLLRQEAQRGTRGGRKILDIMLQGLLVPTVRARRHRGRGKKEAHRGELPRKPCGSRWAQKVLAPGLATALLP